PAAADPKGDVLGPLLAAGVPVALWVRRRPGGGPPCPGAAPCPGAELAPFSHAAPRDLPDRVRELRQQAPGTEDTSNPGRHVSLLYDDPGRTPPDYAPDQQLRPPQPTR